MIEEIRALEQIARALEPSRSEREQMLRAVTSYVQDFLDGNADLPAYVVSEEMGRGILESGIGEERHSISSILKEVALHVDRPGLNPASGGHLGYIPGGGIFHSALGDLMADITNRYSGVFYASPGAVRMEHLLTDWMAGLIGFPPGSAGTLTSGGSIANLVGITTARDARRLLSRDYERAVVYSTDQVHHSIHKALKIAGMAEAPMREVPLDDRYRMRTDELERLVQEDMESGFMPWLVVASAGTTDTGAIDPLDAIAGIAARHRLWFHVDAAYGGFFALCEDGRELLRGIEAADSVVMDPHKTLFLPYGSGAVLVRRAEDLHRSQYYLATYLQDTTIAQGEVSPADLSPELTRPFRGLRLWLPLRLLGLAPFRAALDEKRLLARYAWERLRAKPGFEVGPEPDLSVVTFRYLPRRGNPDVFNEQLLRKLQEDGRIFISSTRINEVYILRFAIVVFRTHLETVDLALELVAEFAADLEEKL